MLVKVTVAREGLKTGDAPVETEVLAREAEREQPEHYYDDAVVLFALMLEKLRN